MRQGREGRKPRQVVLVNILLLWASMAESRWRPLEMSQSTSAGSPTPGASKQGYLLSNSCFQWLRAVPKNIKSTPSSLPAHIPQACLIHAKKALRKRVTGPGSLWDALSALKWISISPEVAGGCTDLFKIRRPCRVPVIPAAWPWHTAGSSRRKGSCNLFTDHIYLVYH